MQYTSGRMWIVATYKKEPAEISRSIPTQNIMFFYPEPDSQIRRVKYDNIVETGAERVNAYKE